VTDAPRPTELPDWLLDAYRATEYRVMLPGGPLVLRIGQHSAGLASLMQAHGVTSVAYVTACNPRSRVHDEAWNLRARSRLDACLDDGGWPCLEGLGIDPDGGHPGEPSVLVLGIAPGEAEALARAFDQDAIVVAGPEATPRLVLLR